MFSMVAATKAVDKFVTGGDGRRASNLPTPNRDTYLVGKLDRRTARSYVSQVKLERYAHG